MSFIELDHTADILIRVHALSLEECFAEGGRALMNVMYRNAGTAGKTIERQFSVDAVDTIGLMHDFLSEVLCISESENLVFSDFEVYLSEGHLDVKISGAPFNGEINGGGSEVKGISFSCLNIIKDEQGYAIDILFDV
jgi:SHS2 domain-containing protein